MSTSGGSGVEGADNQVCVNYKDEAALRAESEEGRRLGFDGKVGLRSPAQTAW